MKLNEITIKGRSFFLYFILCFAVITLSPKKGIAQDQHPPFWKEIQDFKKADAQHPPKEGVILFVGSSSFAKWKDVNDYFPEYEIINRGFGGSTFSDAIRYAHDIIFPYKPRQIVLYEGDNDAVSGDRVSGIDIANNFKELYKLIREKLPEVNITYISIKPSPSRKDYFSVMEKANWEIQEFINTQKNTAYIDIWHLMLDEFGEPREGLFGSDELHMNAKGYEIWKNAIHPYLID